MKTLKLPFGASFRATSPFEAVSSIQSSLSVKVNRKEVKTLREKLIYFKNYLLRGDGNDFGIVSRKRVVNNFLERLAKTIGGIAGTTMTSYRFHGWGTSSTAEQPNDTNLGAPKTLGNGIPAVDDVWAYAGSDSVESSVPGERTYQSVAILTASATIAVTEHGMFSAGSYGSDELLDRSVFPTINLSSGDSIQFTYRLTITSQP